MKEKRTLAVLVDNESGVLSQVSRLFARKGFNIESLTVGTTDNPRVSRMTIEVNADDDQTVLLCNQLRKLLPVHSVKLLDTSNSIRRELVIIKAKTESQDARDAIIQIANIFRASIIDASIGALTIAVIGDESKTGALEKMVSETGILEIIRTGVAAVERGLDTIYEDTKVKGEFNYGKNVL